MEVYFLMISIDINKAASYQNLDILKRLFRKDKWMSVEIQMDYNAQEGLPSEENAKHWPFKAWVVEDGETYAIRIYSLTVGYGGTGPHDFASILDFFDLPYEEDDIFTKRRMSEDGFIHLKYSRYWKR